MYQVALERLGTSPEETLVIGDRLETSPAAIDIGIRHDGRIVPRAVGNQILLSRDPMYG